MICTRPVMPQGNRSQFFCAAAALAVQVCAMAQPPNEPPRLTWLGDPHTTVTISWDREIAGTGMVEYGLTESYGASLSDGIATNEHTLTLTGLTAGATYYYRVFSTDAGDYISSNRFRTAPSATGSFTFAAIGDTLGDSGAHQSVVDALRALHPDFYIHVGDLTLDGLTWSYWTAFMDIEKELMAEAPFMPAAGNHETITDPASLYWRFFPLPFAAATNVACYSYTVGNAHFIVLDTDQSGNEAQRAWLEADLQIAHTNADVAWIICYFHYPPFSRTTAHDTEQDTLMANLLRGTWCSLFQQYGVDLVLSGHNHIYERSETITGVTYIVTGGGSAPVTGITNWWTVVQTSCLQFVFLEVAGGEMRLRAIGNDGMTFDEITFTLPEPACAWLLCAPLAAVAVRRPAWWRAG